MKKIFILLLSAFILLSWSTNAQVTNLSDVTFNPEKLAGHWKADETTQSLKAEKGNELTIMDPVLTYWDAATSTLRLDGGTRAVASGLGVQHGLAATAEEGMVQKFCMMFDLKIDENKGSGPDLTSLYYRPEKSDGCIFIGFSNSAANRKNAIGFNTYQLEVMKPGEWHRIILNFDLSTGTQHIYVIYTDGTYTLYEGAGGATNNHLLADKLLYFLGDNNGDNEYGRVNVAQLALFNSMLDVDDLDGLGIPKPADAAYPNMSSADDSNESWYYIKNLRGTGVLTDLGVGEAVDCFPAMNGYEDNQLWKMVGTTKDDFYFINKLGHSIALDGETSNFSIVESGENSPFSLTNSTYSDADYDISSTINIKQRESSLNISKRTGNTGFTTSSSVSSMEAAFVFLTESEIGTKWNAPVMSTDTEEHWYAISFRASNKAIYANGINSKVRQETLDVTDGRYLWKFVGSLNDLKMVSYNGDYYMCYSHDHASFGTDFYLVRDESEASPLKFEAYRDNSNPNNTSWRLKSTRDIRSAANIYLNNRSASTVTLYSLGDTDSDLRLTKIEIPTTTWTGYNNEWTNPENWTDGVPTAISDVRIIPTATSSQPKVPDGTTIGTLWIGYDIDLMGSLTVTRRIKVEKTVSSFTWYPIGFPFEAAAYYDGFPEDPELQLYDSSIEGANGDYWLKSFNGSSFEFVNAHPYEKNTGYIAQYPSYFEGEKITYMSPVRTTVNGGGVITPEQDVYKLFANPTLSAYFVESTDMDYYYKYNSGTGNFELKEGMNLLQPFEAVIAVRTNDPSKLRSFIEGEEGLTGLDMDKQPEEKVKEIRYYNLQGIQVVNPTDGEIYLEKKTYENGEEITTKFIKSTKSK